MDYQLLANNPDVVLRSDGAYVVIAADGHAADDYRAWLAAGGVPAPADPVPVPVPAIVTRFQACAALDQAGLLDQTEAIMADLNVPRLAKLAWNTAQEFRRASPLVSQLGALLGLDDAALDQLFITADGIQA
jgi:hypothetical protein